jgi:iron(III) transport system permease protein
MRRPRFAVIITLLALGFLALFLLYPLFGIFQASVLDPTGAHLTGNNYLRVLARPFYQRALGNSLAIGAAATLVTTAVGVPLAFCLARLAIPGKPLLLALATLPLVLPSFVSAYALVLLFGRAGIVTQELRAVGIPFESIYGASGLVAVYTLTLFPYVVLPTLAAFKSVDISVEEAGQNLGASRWRVWRSVILPIVMPAVLAGALLVFMDTLENFGVPFVLAEDMPILAVEAWKQFVGETGGNPATAGVLGVLLIVCTTLALLAQRHYLARRRFATGARTAPPLLAVGPRWRAAAIVYSWGIVALALVPFCAVVVISFMRFRGPVITSEFGLGNFIQLFARAPGPLTNTLMLAAAGAVGGAIIGVPIGYVLTRTRTRLAGLLDIVAMVPFAVAGTVLGIGLVIAFNAGFLVLTGGWLILVIAYVVRKLPFNVRASSAILHQIDPSLEEASVNLGVSPALTFIKLTVPLMLGGIVGGAVLTFVTVASELSATVILYSGKWSTMTIVMFQALEGTSAGVASAAATVLIVVTILPLALVNRLLRRQGASLL